MGHAREKTLNTEPVIKDWKMSGIVSQNRKRQHEMQNEDMFLLMTQNGGRLMESDSASKQTWSSG